MTASAALPPLSAANGHATARGRVLVCDDSATARTFLVWLLEPLYDVLAAATGEEAVAALERFGPDVILCDVWLPGIPGTEVCRRARQHPAARDVPFVLVTQLEDEDARAQGLEAGADDLMRKPLHEREVLARVASLVRQRREVEALHARIRTLERALAERDGVPAPRA